MFVEYYYFKSQDIPVIGLNTNTYTFSTGDELFKRLPVINALCFINKGQDITINFENSYDIIFKKGLFGFKPAEKVKHDSVEKFFSEHKYPEEFELTGEIGDNPKVSDNSFYKTNGASYFYASRDVYTIRVPESYSSKIYNDLKVRLGVRKSAIQELVRKATRSVHDGSFIILDTHTTRLTYRVDSLHSSTRLSFSEMGMENLPDEIDYIVAFSEELIACCSELFELEYGDTRSDLNIYYDNNNTSGWVKTYMKVE